MNTFTTTAYNTLGQAVEHETTNDSWRATETCLDFSMLYGYAETLDAWGRHSGEYGDRPASLGQRAY
jgi:hypothetical protein